jgi:four helix bundle protein
MGDEIVSFRDLIVWQKAMDLADIVFRITERYPAAERYGLAFHTRKTSVSIPSNIAEGTRHRRAGYLQRVIYALGEHAELETQMLLADRRHYISAADLQAFTALSAEVGRLAHGLARSLERAVAAEAAVRADASPTR